MFISYRIDNYLFDRKGRITHHKDHHSTQTKWPSPTFISLFHPPPFHPQLLKNVILTKWGDAITLSISLKTSQNVCIFNSLGKRKYTACRPYFKYRRSRGIIEIMSSWKRKLCVKNISYKKIRI